MYDLQKLMNNYQFSSIDSYESGRSLCTLHVMFPLSYNCFSLALSNSLANSFWRRSFMAGVKPPNILVLSEPGEGHFERIKSDIFQCLGKDRYTIYPLSERDIYSQPWQENCLLLVVPPHVPLSNRIRRYLLSYIKGGEAGGGTRGGGKCLSFNPGLTPSMSHDGIGTAGAVQLVPCDSSIKPFYTLRSMDASFNNGLTNGTSAANGSVDDDSFVTGSDLMSDATTAIIGNVLVDGVTVPCVKHVTWTGSSSKGEEGERGQLMYSSVHLFDPLIFTSDLPGVIKIKETGREREEFLASVVFRGLGLIVDTEGKRMEEELSPVYLVTKDEKVTLPPTSMFSLLPPFVPSSFLPFMFSLSLSHASLYFIDSK